MTSASRPTSRRTTGVSSRRRRAAVAVVLAAMLAAGTAPVAVAATGSTSIGAVPEAAAAAPAPAAAGPVTELSVGSFALKYAYTAAAPVWSVGVEDQSTPARTMVEESAVFRVDGSATVGDDEASGWLGQAGSTSWSTTSDAAAGVRFGVSSGVTSGLLQGTASTRRVTVGLDAVVAPDGGDFLLYRASGGVPSTPIVGTGADRSGVTRASSYEYRPGNLTDTVASFTTPGMYCVSLSVSSVLATGEAVSDSTTVRFAVGDVPADAPCGTTGGATGPTDPTDPADPTDPTDPGAPDGVAVVTDGHLDAWAPRVLPTPDGGSEFRLQAKLEGASTLPKGFYDYDRMVIEVPDTVRSTVVEPSPAGDFSFLAPAGSEVWTLPETQKAGVPWVGGDSRDDSLAALSGDTLTWRVDAVTGAGGSPRPGELVGWGSSTYQTSSIAPAFSTRQGLPDGFTMNLVGGHTHMNWTFTAPGTYCVQVSALGTWDDGSRAEDTRQLTFAVGVDPTGVTPCEDGTDLPVPATPTVAGPDGTHLIDSGVLELTPSVRGGTLAVSARHETSPYATTAPDYDPQALVIAPAMSRTTLSATADQAIAAHGSVIYQTITGTGVGMGIDATKLRDGQVAGGTVGLRLTTVDGPGSVTFWAGSTGRGPLLSNRVDVPSSSAVLLAGSAERVVKWGFSEPGVYCVGVEWSATIQASGSAATVPQTLTFVVSHGDARTDPSTVTPCADGGQGSDPGTDPGTGPDDSSGGWADLPDSGREVLSVGHMDVLSTRSGSALKVQVHDDNYSPAKVHEIDDVTFFAASESQVSSSALSRVFGSGADTAWVLPQVQDQDLLWPGWNVSPSGTTVTWALDRVRGPGRFALFQTIGFDTISVLLSSFGSQKSFSYDEHAHGSWGFTEQGVYCLDSTFSAGSGTSKVSRSVTLLLGIGDVDPAKVTTAMCGRAPGEIVDDSLPTAPPRPVAESALTAGARGPVTVANAVMTVSGGTVDVFAGTENASRAVSLWWYSMPTHLGWARVGADGWVRGVKVPGTTYGPHKLVVLDRGGELVGWAPVQVGFVSGGGGDGGGGGSDLGGTGGGSGDPGAGAAPVAGEACVATPVTRTVSASNVEVATSGHFDFGSQLVNGQLVSRVKDDRSGAVWKDPGSLVFHVSDTARQTLPAGYEFLGGPGTTVWSIPLTQKDGVPWLGWNTQHPSLLSGVSGPVTFTLTAVDGPGQLAVYMDGTFGGVGTRVWDTVGGPRSASVGLNQHVHANWSFTAPGAYHVTFTQTATTTGGQRVSSTGTLNFFVGSGDPTAAASSTTVTDWVGRTASGAECDLSADQLTAARGSTTPVTLLTARASAQVGAPGAVLDEATGEHLPDGAQVTASGTGQGDAQERVDPAGQGPAVAVLSVLAGLALAGAAGTGTMWWRRIGKVVR